MKKIILCLGLLAGPSFAYSDNAESNMSFENNEQPWRHRRVMCVATSGIGFRNQRFFGRGYSKWQASRRALRKCRRRSFAPWSCRIAYCDRGRPGWDRDHDRDRDRDRDRDGDRGRD